MFEDMKDQCGWRCSEQGGEGNEMKVEVGRIQILHGLVDHGKKFGF